MHGASRGKRFAQNAEDAGLEQEFVKLSERIAGTHGSGARAAAPAPVRAKNP